MRLNFWSVRFGLGILFFAFASISHAVDLSWKGKYRFEGLSLQNPDLGDGRREKSYILNHLILEPKIVPTDGVVINGRFDIMNNENYPASQVGQVLGGPVTAANSGCSSNRPGADCSRTTRRTMADDTLRVTQLYLHWLNEQSSLVIGRAPIQFGLGMTYNPGLGDFDHWLETRGLVAYKIVMGNLSITPMYSKLYEGQLIGEEDMTQFLIQLQYDNPDTDLSMGVMYDVRNAPKWANDPPFGAGAYGGTGASISTDSGWNTRLLSVFVKKRTETFSFGMEGGFLSGSTGVNTSTGAGVGVESFGLATETEYKPLDSKWSWSLKAGLAGGDNINSPEKHDAFFFNRNYDIAFLMFNHHLGGWNATGSRAFVGERGITNLNAKEHLNSVDSDTVTNTMYIAPGFRQRLGEKWSWTGRFVYANLQEVQAPSASRDLGIEVDFGVQFRPHENVNWVTEIGALFPGTGWSNSGTPGIPATAPLQNAYGLQTRAAFSF